MRLSSQAEEDAGAFETFAADVLVMPQTIDNPIVMYPLSIYVLAVAGKRSNCAISVFTDNKVDTQAAGTAFPS